MRNIYNIKVKKKKNGIFSHESLMRRTLKYVIFIASRERRRFISENDDGFIRHGMNETDEIWRPQKWRLPTSRAAGILPCGKPSSSFPASLLSRACSRFLSPRSITARSLCRHPCAIASDSTNLFWVFRGRAAEV